MSKLFLRQFDFSKYSLNVDPRFEIETSYVEYPNGSIIFELTMYLEPQNKKNIKPLMSVTLNNSIKFRKFYNFNTSGVLGYLGDIKRTELMGDLSNEYIKFMQID